MSLNGKNSPPSCCVEIKLGSCYLFFGHFSNVLKKMKNISSLRIIIWPFRSIHKSSPFLEMVYLVIAIKQPSKFNSFRHLPLVECNFPTSIKRLVKQRIRTVWCCLLNMVYILLKHLFFRHLTVFSSVSPWRSSNATEISVALMICMRLLCHICIYRWQRLQLPVVSYTLD